MALDDDMRMLTGGSSGEHEAREALLMALGPGWNVMMEIDREKGDTLTLETPEGEAFEISAERLLMSWRSL